MDPQGVLSDRCRRCRPFPVRPRLSMERRPSSEDETGVRWKAIFPDRPELSLRGYSLFWEGWLGETVSLIEGCIARESAGIEADPFAGSLFRVRAILLREDPPRVLSEVCGGIGSLPRLVCAMGKVLRKAAGPLIQAYIPERTFWWNGRAYFLPNGEMVAVIQVQQIDGGKDG